MYINKATRNFSCYKCLTSSWTLVIEQYSITSEKAIGFSIIYSNPISILLCNPVWTPRIERSFFILRIRINTSIQLTSRSLIDFSLIDRPRDLTASRILSGPRHRNLQYSGVSKLTAT